MKPDESYRTLKYVIFLVVGSVLNGIGAVTFTASANVAPGGITGLAIMGNYLWGMPIGVLTAAINAPIILCCFLFMGKEFGIKNLINILVVSVIIDAVVTPLVPVYTGERLMGTLFGAVFSGLGLGLIYVQGAPTAGSGAISYMIHRKMPHMPIGNILMVMDCTIVLISTFVYKNIETAMYGIISLYVTILIMNWMMAKAEHNSMVTVISEKSREIADDVMQHMNRGVTFLEGHGGYTGNPTQVMITAIKPQQFGQLKDIIEAHDKNAFYTVSDIQKTKGSNFRPN